MTMQKSFLLSLFGLLLLSCQTQEIQKEEPALGDAGGFLTVRIMTDKASPATKADNPYNQGSGEYLDGTSVENKISHAILFFFNDDGDAQAIATDNSGSRSWFYIDNFDDGSTATPDHSQTVEKITVPIKIPLQPEGKSFPTQVLAVLNPTETILGLRNSGPGPNLNALLGLVEDYEGISTDSYKQKLAEEGNFVMSNSVYYDDKQENKPKIQTTRISSENYYTQQQLNAVELGGEQAVNNFIKEHLVTIYVERVLARLDLSMDLYYDKDKKEPVVPKTVGETLLYKIVQAPTPVNNGLTIEQIEIYVKFCGWTLIDTPDRSRLIKEIKAWPNDLFKNDEIWNSADYHRSFWAVNPDLDPEQNYKRGPYNRSKVTTSNNSTWNAGMLLDEHDIYPMPKSGGDPEKAYMQENAAPYMPENTATEINMNGPDPATKVVIAAQMVDKDGKPIDLYQWAGAKYTKYGIQMMVANILDLYRKTGEEYTKIKPEDIDFYKTTEGNEMITYAALAKTSESTTWYIKEVNDGKTTFTQTEDANAYIKGMVGDKMGKNTVNHWVNGYTYYYFPIRHLGGTDSPAEYGVVRNHIYDAKVTSMSGFGAPEYDSGDKYNDEFYMSAEVKILSWRVVHQDYDLTW